MPPLENGTASEVDEAEADFAKVRATTPEVGRLRLTTTSQAFQELAKGEQTAAALESHLTSLEARIEQLLAQANENQVLMDQAKATEQAATDGEAVDGADSGEQTRHTPNGHA